MKLIMLSQGLCAKVDDCDYERLNRYKWHAFKNRYRWYAIRNIRVGGRRTTSQMHREILGLTQSNIKVDHRNGDGLDNQRHNLRRATNSQNGMNRKGWGKSGIKGVYRENGGSSKRPWTARIRLNGKAIYIGCFETPGLASRAYNEKALAIFGEFANLNP